MVTTSIIIAACIYAAYNAVALAFFGVPESLSNTYYLYQGKCTRDSGTALTHDLFDLRGIYVELVEK